MKCRNCGEQVVWEWVAYHPYVGSWVHTESNLQWCMPDKHTHRFELGGIALPDCAVVWDEEKPPRPDCVLVWDEQAIETHKKS